MQRQCCTCVERRGNIKIYKELMFECCSHTRLSRWNTAATKISCIVERPCSHVPLCSAVWRSVCVCVCVCVWARPYSSISVQTVLINRAGDRNYIPGRVISHISAPGLVFIKCLCGRGVGGGGRESETGLAWPGGGWRNQSAHLCIQTNKTCIETKQSSSTPWGGMET